MVTFSGQFCTKYFPVIKVINGLWNKARGVSIYLFVYLLLFITKKTRISQQIDLYHDAKARTLSTKVFLPFPV